ncbi:uncharacterized protein LOC110178917 [Drosophila serrata]|uniref:uncharacterized protein LOC110178917 n=1 Tax=Drosophila serrata TaxID=7274 RepID=UPI000A1D0EED|nr:uncharacterized protein LOC110178917 [Drosophila serrata]
MSVNIGSRNMFIINAPDEEEKCTEAQLDILLKINTGEYRLVKKNKRSSVWNVYREIARSDGTKLKWRYFCLGCKRVMQSSGGTTSNLRIHKCHVRYLKQNGGSRSPSGDASYRSPSPRAAPAASQTPRSQQSTEQRAPVAMVRRAPNFASQFEQLYEVRPNTLKKYTDMEDDTEESHLEEEADDADQIIESERILEPTSSPPKPRPLLKLFSEDSWSCEPELDPEEPEESVLDEQTPIELDHNDIQQKPVDDYKEEILQPKTLATNNQFNASALSEAECYAKSWAHAFLRLSDEQKFYAKRSIDELLVLGRLEKLSISTVTSLTTNL